MGDTRRNEGVAPGAKFFGEDNPFELQILQNQASSANDLHLGQAAQHLEFIFGNKHAWVTLFYHRQVFEGGGNHFKIFVDADDGQLVCVDVLVAGELTTPKLDAEGVVDEIQPAVGVAAIGVKRVMSLRWQVRQKLAAGATRRKFSDYGDLQWLCDHFKDEIKRWIEEEDEAQRKKFCQWMLENEFDDDRVEVMKDCMGL